MIKTDIANRLKTKCAMFNRNKSAKNERETNEQAVLFGFSVRFTAGNKSFSKCPDYDTIINVKRLFSHI